MSMKLAGLMAAAVLTVSGCGGSSSSNSSSDNDTDGPQTLDRGVLTLAVPFFPYPGFAEGEDITNPTGGFYTELGNKLAADMGLEPKWVPIDWTAMIGGQAKGYDITATAITKLPDRMEIFDMTTTLDSDYLALMVKEGTPAGTAEDIRDMVIASCGACDSAALINDVIKPSKTPLALDQDLEKYQALKIGRADAAMGDLSTILSMLTKSEYEGYEVACRFDDPIERGWALEKDSPLFEEVDGLLQSYKDDGTADELFEEWVVPTLGGVVPEDVTICPSFN